jgi:lysophospholipase L1-like esterase
MMVVLVVYSDEAPYLPTLLLAELAQRQYHVVVLCVGTNDLGRGTPADLVYVATKALAEQVFKHGAQLVVTTLPPSVLPRAAEYHTKLRNLAAFTPPSSQFQLVELHTLSNDLVDQDGLHLTVAGYRAMAANIHAALQKLNLS